MVATTGKKTYQKICYLFWIPKIRAQVHTHIEVVLYSYIYITFQCSRVETLLKNGQLEFVFALDISTPACSTKVVAFYTLNIFLKIFLSNLSFGEQTTSLSWNTENLDLDTFVIMVRGNGCEKCSHNSFSFLLDGNSIAPKQMYLLVGYSWSFEGKIFLMWPLSLQDWKRDQNKMDLLLYCHAVVMQMKNSQTSRQKVVCCGIPASRVVV